ncbi:uncharacterized protein [Lepeophtheirus salmonis]|uniref:uncharacterized protein isoform X3 n=1 Tax=Lepeophtheirus salmonis TaxID=72036 RepID=UPI001AE9C1B5|nr:uncharacterized protein LOC121129180 isoform X3 [Lepeophtheirus salmonis]
MSIHHPNQFNMKIIGIYLLLTLLHGSQGATNGTEELDSFSQLIPQRSCSYSSYNGHLTCACDSIEMNVTLNIQFINYTRDSNVKKVIIKQCNRLHISLDFRKLQAGSFPIIFKSIRRVEIQNIIFDPMYKNRQELELDFNNIETFEFNGIFVNETIKINATNIKDAHFIKSHFEHIPTHGFTIKNAKDLLVKDSYFRHVEPRFILVEDTKSVLVMGNQMPINAVQVVQAADGSHLMISCNRLLHEPVSPECTKTTMATTTVSVTTTTSTSTTTEPLVPVLSSGSETVSHSSTSPGDTREGVTPEIVGGVIAGLLIIIILLIILICVLKKKKRGISKTGSSALVEDPELQKPFANPEKAILSTHNEGETDDASILMMMANNEDEDDDCKPKFASPVWIDEIQRNKIFNRQKSLLSHDDLKSQQFNDHLSDEENQENSRTESEDDFDKDAPSAVEADLPYSPLLKEDDDDKLSNLTIDAAEEEKEPTNSVGAVVSDSASSPPPSMENDLEELESLLAKVREQERALNEGDTKPNTALLSSPFFQK